MTLFRQIRCGAKSRCWDRDQAVRILGMLTFAGLAVVAPALHGETPVAASPPKGLYGGDVVTGIVGEASSVACDHEGVIWVGSTRLGIFAHKDDKWTLFNERNTPIPDVGIAKIFVDRKNIKWFVSSEGMLYSFDNKEWHVYKIAASNVLHTVLSICDDPHGNLWLGMQGGSLLQFANANFSSVVEQFRFVDPNSAPGLGDILASVCFVACDSKGRVWVHEAKVPRLLMFDGQKWRLPPVNPRLFPIYALMPGEKDGEMLIGSQDGLYAVSDTGRQRSVTRWPPITETTVRVWHSADGRCVLGNREGATVVDGEKVRSYHGESLQNGLWVRDVAFDRERVWIAARWGLSYLSGDKITPVSLTENNRFVNLTARSWRDRPLVDLVNAKPSEAKILDVLKDPAKYANQKLRIVGSIRSGFEYAAFVDKDGKDLGIWPDMYQPWWAFLKASGLDEEPDVLPKQDEDPDLSHAARMGANLRNWPPPAKKPTKNLEFLGYLDWGGNFGHMGGWGRQFTTIESYPVDLDKKKREAVHKAYLKYLSALPGDPRIDARTAVTASKGRESLQGTWLVKRVDGFGDYYENTFVGWKWTIRDDQLMIGCLGRRLRGNFAVDAHTRPARLDWAPSNVYFHHEMGLGIYRLDGKTLTVAFSGLPGVFGSPMGDDARPTDFVHDEQKGPVVFTLERTANDPPSGLPPDDPAAVAKVGRGQERDRDGNIVSVYYSQDMKGETTTYPDDAFKPLAGLAHLESVSCNWNVLFTPKALTRHGQQTCAAAFASCTGHRRQAE